LALPSIALHPIERGAVSRLLEIGGLRDDFSESVSARRGYPLGTRLVNF
jgi:hypothetical protein